MEDRRSIAKKAAIGVALVIAAAGAVLFYKNNIAMNPGDTLLKYMSYVEDGKYEKMYDLLNEESKKSISKEEFIKRNKNIYKGIGVQTIDADVTSKKRSTTVTYHVKMQTNAGIITYNNRTDFVKENHRYRVHIQACRQERSYRSVCKNQRSEQRSLHGQVSLTSY